MAHEETLPWELIEEILSRVPPESLLRFKTVSKQWNALFDDKTFINNHKTTFRFILATKSKIYSVSIDPKIAVCELTLDIPGLESQILKSLVDGNELLLCDMEKGAVVWNPWLRHSRWIDQDSNHTKRESYGLGYNNKGSYKIFAACDRKENPNQRLLTIRDFASDAWKDRESGDNSQQVKPVKLHRKTGVSLNGNLYLVTYYEKTDLVYHLTKINSSSESIVIFCDLPCGTTNFDKDALVLRVFEGDRFSLLKQCHATKKIELWVSKYKINNNLDREDVEWIKFMELSSPNLPDLVDGSNSQPSYFIGDKRLVVCSCDETGRVWIYVLGGNKLISKTQIDSVVDLWPSHCTFIPSLVPVPLAQREEPAELQV
ncbi:F-box family protein [Arabidopsis lyrata subsp. lyrata]|uniref:F-box family protein n=1 Tax=Arabidopsis lyrata subsp. lyrata TaxID=81972 RepID=D7L647_ARALL|nr:F-box/kelch-repeat protein At3g16580 [Arabidopsis lyrata subsp. lyrata]EFH61412.1 F-box family protein [Arabidopsis lyrata subsp. lyrata]|eukprot:XP_002885153.1 F-box/kelch-repeat protein At3g16580 [Arabidopsis lyrata subsp. lyrata]